MNTYMVKYVTRFMFGSRDAYIEVPGETEVEAKSVKKAINIVENHCSRHDVKREVTEVKLI